MIFVPKILDATDIVHSTKVKTTKLKHGKRRKLRLSNTFTLTQAYCKNSAHFRTSPTTLFLSKLTEEADIILVELANIVNAVFQHGKAINAEAKGEAAVLSWIYASGF